jgi:hypothetical protein
VCVVVLRVLGVSSTLSRGVPGWQSNGSMPATESLSSTDSSAGA